MAHTTLREKEHALRRSALGPSTDAEPNSRIERGMEKVDDAIRDEALMRLERVEGDMGGQRAVDEVRPNNAQKHAPSQGLCFYFLLLC